MPVAFSRLRAWSAPVLLGLICLIGGSVALTAVHEGLHIGQSLTIAAAVQVGTLVSHTTDDTGCIFCQIQRHTLGWRPSSPSISVQIAPERTEFSWIPFKLLYGRLGGFTARAPPAFS